MGSRHALCHPVPQYIKCNNKKTHSAKRYVFLGILPKAGGLLRGTLLGLLPCSTCSRVESGAVGPFHTLCFSFSPTEMPGTFSWLDSSDVIFCIRCWFGFRVLLLSVGFQWSTRAAFSTILPYRGVEPAPERVKGHAESRCMGGFAVEPGLESCPTFPSRSFPRVL